MENMKDSLPDKDFNGAKTLPPETQAPPPRVVTSQGSRSASATVTQSKVLVRIPVFYSSILKIGTGRLLNCKILLIIIDTGDGKTCLKSENVC